LEERLEELDQEGGSLVGKAENDAAESPKEK